MTLKASKLRKLSVSDLHKKAEKLRAEYMRLRYQSNQGKIKNVHEIRSVRRDHARVLTILREMVQDTESESVMKKK